MRYIILALIIVLSFASSAYGKKKDKVKQVQVPRQEQRLSHDDMLRYQYFYLESIRANDAEHYTEAYELLRHCLEINPEASESHFAIARFEMALGNDSLAQMHYETALKLDPDNEEFAEKLAQYYLNKQQIAEGTKVYEQLAERYPDRTEYVEMLVNIYEYNKDYAKVLECLNRLEVLEGQSENLTLSKMQVYSFLGDTKGAYNELNRLVKKHPNDLNYKVMMGNWLLSNGRKEDALKAYQAVLKEEPDNAQAQMSLMDYYRTVNNFDEADKLLYSILENPKTESETRITLMRQVVSDNEKAGADSTRVLNIFSRVLSLPQKGSEMAEMKVAYMQLKSMPEDSIKAGLNEVLEISPENTQARLMLLQMLWKDSVDSAVIGECEKAIAYNPEEPELYYFLGLAKYLTQDDDGALDAFQKATGYIRSDTPADIASRCYMLLGDLYHQKNLPQKAYEAYDSCLYYNPEEISCLNNYAYYLSVEGKQLKKAEQMSYKTIKAEPENETYLDTYAWILYSEERYEEARIYIDQALKVDSASLSSVYYEHAGDIYYKLNLNNEAIDFWNKALEKGADNADDIKKKIENANK